ncbi:NAF1-domain-containing protein [Ceratobasidium sp. AG-I]|nr:NAF1-domain-containing protein [Ceratobasidium sp. AG-I]
MRVTKYPTRVKQLASLTALIRTTDSDVEDEDDAPSGSSKQYAGTKNEILVPEVEVPDITEVPADDVLEQIGEIMTIIDSVIVVKGNTTGVHCVLDTDSLLVFEDRKVLGKVFETFGAVKQPLYSIRFPSAAVIDKNTFWIGRVVCHVPARSNFVFTEAIARIKGSDASNLHDEEIAEDQMDFSDDEAEAQWRRNRSATHSITISLYFKLELSITRN